MEQFNISIAGLTVDVACESRNVKNFFSGYSTDADRADFSARPEPVEAAQRMQEGMSASSAELLSLHRSIAEQLPFFDRLLVHGAAIEYKGRGFLFTAPSGTGKSTHIRLWRQYIGKDVDIVNGDKPIIDLSGQVPLVCGTPWAGKENWHRPVQVPLEAVVLLRRGQTDVIRQENPSELLFPLLNQIYRPRNGDALQRTLALTDRLLRAVRVYCLECTPTEAAVQAAFPALTNVHYPEEANNES